MTPFPPPLGIGILRLPMGEGFYFSLQSFCFLESKLDISLDIWYAKNGKQTFHSIERRDLLRNRLEELRKSLGISQEELAAALSVSRQTIGSLENGRYNPSILLAFKIAHYFECTIEDIFIYEEEMT